MRNGNPLLHNLEKVTGLKTGTTNKSGACLVTSLSVDDGTTGHDLIVVVLGTEDSIERGRVSGLMARYALRTFYEGREEPGTGADAQLLPIRGGGSRAYRKNSHKVIPILYFMRIMDGGAGSDKAAALPVTAKCKKDGRKCMGTSVDSQPPDTYI